MSSFLLPGCTFSPGHSFGEIANSSLKAAFIPGEERDLGEGRVLVNTGDEVKVDSFVATLTRVEVLAPDGDDFVTVAGWALDSEVDLIEGLTVALPTVAGIEAASASKLSIGFSKVALVGRVFANEEDREDNGIPLSGEIMAEDAAFDGKIALPFGRGHAPSVTLSIDLGIDGTLFDDADFSAWIEDPDDSGASGGGRGSDGIDLGTADDLSALVLAHLDACQPKATVVRKDWLNP